MKTWFRQSRSFAATWAFRPINRPAFRNRGIQRGGAGKSKSGGGWQQLTSPWGLLAKGYRTRNRRKHSNRFILVRRDGRPMKNP